MQSWTVDFFKEWSSRMDLRSIARLRRCLVRAQQGSLRQGNTVVLHMKRPLQGRVRLREWGTDHVTFTEIVVDEVYKSVISEIPAPRTLIDLGANIGLSSLYFASHWPSCRILAVEPNRDTYELLSTNLAPLTRSGRGKALLAGVWDSHVPLSPAPSQTPGAFNGFRLCEAAAGSVALAGVEGMTMTEIISFSGFDYVDLLKVDIEGAEARLFSGSLAWLTRVHSIAVEFHGDARAACRFDETTRTFGFGLLSEDKHTVLVSKGDHGRRAS